MDYPIYLCHLHFGYPLVLQTDDSELMEALSRSWGEALRALGDATTEIEVRTLASKSSGGEKAWQFESFSDADLQHLRRRCHERDRKLVIAPGWWEVEDYCGGRIMLLAHSDSDAIVKVAESEPGICFSETEFFGPALSLPKMEVQPKPGHRLAPCLEAIKTGGDAFRLVQIVCPEQNHFHLAETLSGHEAGEQIRATILGHLKSRCGDSLASVGDALVVRVRTRDDSDRDFRTFFRSDSFGIESLGTRFRDRFCDTAPRRGWHFFGKQDQRFAWGNSTADASRTLFQRKFPVWNVRPIEDGAVLYDL
jgi:hypothetical protein